MSERRKKIAESKNKDTTEGNEVNDMQYMRQKMEQIEETLTKNNSKLEYTIRKLMQDFKEDMIKTVERKIEVIEGQLHEALVENENLKSEVKRLENELEENQDRTSETKNLIIKQCERFNDLDQYSRRNNIRINGVPESGKETAEDTTKRVIEVLNKNISNLNLIPTDIDISHRLGKQSSQGHRQIIVKFVSRHTRDRVIRGRKAFKSKKVFINEDLTRLNQAVLKAIRMTTPAEETGWSWDGKLFHKNADGYINTVVFRDFEAWLEDEFSSMIFNNKTNQS